ncbi:hypothetical protein DK880_00248 [Candidatus Cardinium hertigii]|uniref:Uncharacterized protein n=1 Tax=Candidatus Cardinium hertigii TaxID=247481 RepID=A0A2Z3LHQ0_9BACT|nr:hypothetical protein DK880_00248 [Candidatus Cardinium hertigii]
MMFLVVIQVIPAYLPKVRLVLRFIYIYMNDKIKKRMLIICVGLNSVNCLCYLLPLRTSYNIIFSTFYYKLVVEELLRVGYTLMG